MDTNKTPSFNFTQNEEVFCAVKKRLYRRLSALARPLSELTDVLCSSASFPFQNSRCLCATDGRLVFWNQPVLKIFPPENAENTLETLLLHQVIHCLFGHPFSMPLSCPPGLWSTACDVAAWQILKCWAPELLPENLERLLKTLSKKLPGFPLYQAHRLAWQLADKVLQDWIQSTLLLDPAFSDSHAAWPVFRPGRVSPAKKADGPQDQGGGNGDFSSKEKNMTQGQRSMQVKALWNRLGKQLTGPGAPLALDQVKNSKRPFGAFGQRGAGARMPLTLTDSRRHDYRNLLKSFARWGEEMKLNENEFQYASYLYGLEHYGGIPLLEPLEYEETAKIRELAIVIDTSASCSQSLTRTFLEETRNLLLEEDLFFHPFNLHILQCDKEVERDDKLTSPEDWKDYIDTLEICGMGGTDFRPAFSHIQHLLKCREFVDLPAILFFTDGVGLYPQESPGVRTIFIFLKGHYEAIDVPDWAEILILETGEMKGYET
jgi:hypothetical protein